MKADIRLTVTTALHALWESHPGGITADEMTSSLACSVLKKYEISLYDIDYARVYYFYNCRKIKGPSELSDLNPKTLLQRLEVRLIDETLLKMYELKRDQNQFDTIKKLINQGYCLKAMHKAASLTSPFTQTIALNQIRDYVNKLEPQKEVENLRAILDGDREDMHTRIKQHENIKKVVFLPDSCSHEDGQFQLHLIAAKMKLVKQWNALSKTKRQKTD